MQKRQKIWLTLVVCLSLVGTAFVMCGCSQESSSKQPEADTSKHAADKAETNDLPSLEPTDTNIGTGNVTLQVMNETGYDIVGLRIRAAGESDYPAENSFDGFDFKTGSSANLSFNAPEPNSRYDVLLLTSEDNKIAIRNIELVDIKDIAFHFKEGIGYVTYTDPKTGNKVDGWEEAVFEEENAVDIPYDLETQEG